MTPNCHDVEEDVYSSARALQCPGHQDIYNIYNIYNIYTI